MVKKTSGTKFPVARIKKIMQTDEDVGKVAQGAPVLISKALELFMRTLVEASVETARRRGAKKIAPYHLKQTVETTPIFDFLNDIVAKVPDPTSGQADDAPAPKPRTTRGKAPTAGPSSTKERKVSVSGKAAKVSADGLSTMTNLEHTQDNEAGPSSATWSTAVGGTGAAPASWAASSSPIQERPVARRPFDPTRDDCAATPPSGP